MNALSNKRVLITGAAGTVGAAVVHAVREAGGAAIASDLKIADGIDFALDVTSEPDWRRIIDEIGRAGRLDGLVNAAGIAVLENLEDTDFATWRRVMSVNLDGAFLGCRQVMALLKRNGGAIVNIASVYGLVGGANLAAYSASKGGLRLLTKSVALHGATLKPPVRCNVVCPAYLDGSMVEGVFAGLPNPDQARQVVTREIPLGRFGRAQEVASACVYLLSDASAFVTGVDFPVDGGLTAR